MFVIGIYPRKSVYRDNSDSIKVQIQLCKDYAGIIYKDKDIKFKIYDKDEGFSGKNMNRPGFRELMEDVSYGRLNAVMVYKLDRISRNVQEFSSMYEIFQKHNVSFVSVKESFDTTTPMGRTVMYILAAFAQLERENTSERVSDNMHALGLSGKWTGGKLPSGFTSIRKKNGDKEHSYLIVDQNTIGFVKILYNLAIRGYPITKIERYCRDNGIKTLSGKFLSTSQIHVILTNPVYCQNSTEAYHYFSEKGCTLPDYSLFDGTKGLIGYGRTRTTASSQRSQNKSDWIIAIGIHEPVIPAADWIKVQNRFGANKMFRSAKYETGILKGVICCGCGGRMDIRTYKKNNIIFSYYYCADMARQGKGKCGTGYIRTEKIEDIFIRELRKIRFDKARIVFQQNSHAMKNIPEIRKSIATLQASIVNLSASLSQAQDTSAAKYIINQINILDSDKKKLEANLKEAEICQETCKSNDMKRDEIYRNICFLLENFDIIDYHGKNELIRKTVKSCIFDGSNLAIVF